MSTTYCHNPGPFFGVPCPPSSFSAHPCSLPPYVRWAVVKWYYAFSWELFDGCCARNTAGVRIHDLSTTIDDNGKSNNDSKVSTLHAPTRTVSEYCATGRPGGEDTPRPTTVHPYLRRESLPFAVEVYGLPPWNIYIPRNWSCQDMRMYVMVVCDVEHRLKNRCTTTTVFVTV